MEHCNVLWFGFRSVSQTGTNAVLLCAYAEVLPQSIQRCTVVWVFRRKHQTIQIYPIRGILNIRAVKDLGCASS